jgi:hypothetical protein
MWSLRTLTPRRSRWRVAQFDTLRLRLIKLAVRIEVLKTKVRLHLPRATPDQALFALLLTRMPRLSSRLADLRNDPRRHERQSGRIHAHQDERHSTRRRSSAARHRLVRTVRPQDVRPLQGRRPVCMQSFAF